MFSKDSERYLICPITLKLFNDPVLAEDEITYEREAITKWISQHGTSPRTKKTLRLNQLIPNNPVKNAVQEFRQSSRIDYGENLQRLENLDVLCLHCGSIEKLNTIKNHKLRCSSNPNNIQQFQIGDDENIFTITPKTTKSSSNRKIFSFQNPLARRSIQTTNNEVPLQTSTENNIPNNSNKGRRCLYLRNISIKYFLIILLILLLIVGLITLAILYIQCREQQHSTTGAASSTSTFTSTRTSISPSTLTSISTSTFNPGYLCRSAQWYSNGITIVSNLSGPYDIGIDSEDNLFVADTENRHLEKYFPNGTNIRLINNTKISSIFIDKFNNIYFTDLFGDEVKKLSSNDQSITTVAGFGGMGSGLDQLKLDGEPSIYVDQNETLYISDTGNNRVIKYYLNSTSGIVVAGGHGAGPNPNQLNTPYGIYVDEINEIGAIYICDKQNHRIQKWLSGANEGIAVASNNTQLSSVMSILLSSTSTEIIMYISSFNIDQILKWIPYEQQYESVVVGIGPGAGHEPNQLFAQRGIKFDKYWNLFVADTGNNRIQKFVFNISSCQN